MASYKNVLYWLLANSLGGKNRLLILKQLFESPQNTHELSKILNIEYKTVQYHLNILEENKCIEAAGHKYGRTFFITDTLLEYKQYFDEIFQKIIKENK